ncbi:MAG: cytochrome b/b6 domain-containing protein [Pseudomonadota bacterium]|nr:cytochrome b/b6 domain-containing protein [Pseudomonadota bacterium]
MSVDEAAEGRGRPPVRVWDLPVRLVHWALAALIPFSWWSARNDHLPWHRLSGYLILGLLVFRLIWGVAGSQTARFAGFLRGPAATLAYLCGRLPTVVGHNPLGGWSVVAMLAALAVQIGLGLFSVDEDGFEAGPLSKFISFDASRAIARIHHLAFYILLALIALHLAAIAYYAVRGRNLTGPMITGRSRLDPGVPPPRMAGAWRVLPVALAAAALAWFVAHGLRF